MAAACDMPGCTGLAADQTFAHHGIAYEINLCGSHAAALDFVLEPFVTRSREVRPAPVFFVPGDAVLTPNALREMQGTGPGSA